MKLRFTKMHGLGNDFVMIDAISQKVDITSKIAKHLADRNFGIGCDQVLIVETPDQPDSDFKYRIFNHDGSEVENCGNGARCFANFVRMRKLSGQRRIIAETASGKLALTVEKSGDVTVNMGAPIFDFEAIPFYGSADDTVEQCVSIDLGPIGLRKIFPVSMGNPHAVSFVERVDQYDFAKEGPLIEAHHQFPQRCNAGFMEILNRNEIKLRVFERGTGETLACGTGACAAVVAGISSGLLNTSVTAHLRGGHLNLQWDGKKTSPVLMKGSATPVFHGEIRI